MNLTETEKAYIAGLFDGEGSIGYYQRGDGKFIPDMRITNTDFNLKQWLEKRLPFGSYKVYKRAGRKVNWEWEIRGKALIADVCHLILPFLVVKKPQVCLLLDLLDAEQEAGCKAGIKTPDNIYQLRVDVIQKLKDLKDASTLVIQ